MKNLKATHLFTLIALALFLTICASVSGWAPIVYSAIAADAVTLGYAFGLKLKLIRAGKHYEPEESEFGTGIVVCLAKFSEHLGNAQAREIWVWHHWMKDGEKGPPPEECRSMKIGMEVRGGAVAALSSAIEMWMNAASDHMYELDEKRAPVYLKELGELTLKIGHGFTGETWTIEDVKLINELWKLSCLQLDKRLKTKPDWGTW